MTDLEKLTTTFQELGIDFELITIQDPGITPFIIVSVGNEYYRAEFNFQQTGKFRGYSVGG